MSETDSIEAVEAHLRQGEPLLAYNAVQKGLALWPQNLRLRQLKGLATARSGDTERANKLLRELADAGHADAETLGILARTHKDLALRAADTAERTKHLTAAFSIYRRAYEHARALGSAAEVGYTGINAAAIAVMQGELAGARQIAAEVRAQCLRALEARAGDYWLAATLGEAALIIGEPTEAAAHYTRAAQLFAGSHGNLASTRRQAALLARHLPGDFAWTAEVLKVPPLLMYTGQLIDPQTGAATRFPRFLPEGDLAVEIRRHLDLVRPLAVYGSAASATDVLILEAMQAFGGETHIVLPFPAADFHRIGGAGAWQVRFERVLSHATSVTITSDHRARGSTATFEYADLIVVGNARLRAQVLDARLSGLVVRNDEQLPEEGTSALLRLWRAQGVEAKEVLLPLSDISAADAGPAAPGLDENEHLPEGFSHEIRAMLFADAVGYSRLSEDQTPDFITQFWGAVAALNARVEQKPEHVETSGDGLYMVFAGVRAAARYALELSDLVKRTDWGARGLPEGMNIRIALHSGPVYRGYNPVTGSIIYTGPHTSRAARIEPITPPGQVYASGAFAAVTAAYGLKELALSYVGRMPLAKDYGAFEIYHVDSASPPPA
ncbi:MAG TPA: tetratricopeptide repeat-containing protein [Steroidobacteraceae bacterium]|jgi:class 3 adenylate cyclase